LTQMHDLPLVLSILIDRAAWPRKPHNSNSWFTQGTLILIGRAAWPGRFDENQNLVGNPCGHVTSKILSGPK
jgi:hypothetical protein